MKTLRVGRGDVEEVRSALAAAGALDGCAPTPAAGSAAPPGGPPAGALPLGAIGFSYSAGPVLLALDGPAPPADFAILFGGYYDLREVILFLTTGRHRDRGVEHDGEALPEGRWVLLGANAERIADLAAREALLSISRRRRADPAAPIDDLAARLDPRARAALDLVANTDPALFASRFAALDADLRGEIDALSPARALAGPLRVDLLLLHGRGDAIIPWTQSQKIHRMVPTTGASRLVLLGGFRHARPDRAGADPWWRTALRHPGDSLRLLAVLQDLLARRQRARGPAASP
jgi:hypothetical protein